MNIRENINNFIAFVIGNGRSNNDIRSLIEHLDELPFLVYKASFEFDDSDYPDPPAINNSELRKRVESKFPSLGYYKTAEYSEDLECTNEIMVGDAIDDLTDIVSDLIDVEWYFSNTSEADALWHLEASYRSHWGGHLRELQLYLYRQHY